MSFNCCLSVAYYSEALSYRNMLYFVYLPLYLRLGLFMSYLCDLFFYYYFYFHYNESYNLTDTKKLVFFGHVCQKFSLRVLLSFFLNFYQSQPGVAYKSVVYKKSVCLNYKIRQNTKPQTYQLHLIIHQQLQ